MHKLWKTIFCSLLIAGIGAGVWTVQQTPANEEAALTLSYPTAFLEQFQPKISMRLLELLPNQEPAETRYPEKMLYPGGQAIGILLRTDGISVSYTHLSSKALWRLHKFRRGLRNFKKGTPSQFETKFFFMTV